MSESILDRLTKKGLGAVIGGTGAVLKHIGPKETDRIIDGLTNFSKDILGTDDPYEIEEAIAANPELALEYKAKIESLALEEYQASLKDIQDARARDIQYIKSGKNNTRADIMAYGSLMFVFLLLSALVFMAIAGVQLTAAILSLFSALLGAGTTFAGTVYAFEFGSSQGSKNKDFGQTDINRQLIDIVKQKDIEL